MEIAMFSLAPNTQGPSPAVAKKRKMEPDPAAAKKAGTFISKLQYWSDEHTTATEKCLQDHEGPKTGKMFEKP